MPKQPIVTNAEITECANIRAFDLTDYLRDACERIGRGYSEKPLTAASLDNVASFLALSRAANEMANALLMQHRLNIDRAELDRLRREARQ